MFKISFIGDIMCEKPLLKACNNKGKYNFQKVFSNSKNIFDKSDYIVGNLETVFAGEDQFYTRELYSFNTPDSFLDALSQAGIDLCITSNNHCLDRGENGLIRTLDELDRRGISHIGTYRSKQEQDECFVKIFGENKVAFLAYTYGTGIKDNHYILPSDKKYMVNLLMPQKIGSPIKYNKSNKKISMIRKIISMLFSEEKKLKIKKLLGKPVGIERIDELSDDLLSEELLNKIKSDIQKAKEKSDIVVVNIHNGGQFNTFPGEYAEFIMKYLSEIGADIVIGHHPHVVQKFEMINDVPCAFSLGNYCISPSTPYIINTNLPEYSIMFHLYVESGEIKKLSFSILKIIEIKTHQLSVYDTYELYNQANGDDKKNIYRDIKFIYEKFVNNKTMVFNKVLDEYPL